MDGRRPRRAAPWYKLAMRWLVDGMNLIGSRPDRWWNDPDGAVRRLIGELDRFAAATGEEVTVVFDRRPPDLQPGRHATPPTTRSSTWSLATPTPPRPWW